MRKFEEILSNDFNSVAANKWFQSCRNHKNPYVIIKPRRKYADVLWDHISFESPIDNIFHTPTNQIQNTTIEIFYKYCNNNSRYWVSSTFIWLKNLEIEQARCAANEVFDLIQEYVFEHNRT